VALAHCLALVSARKEQQGWIRKFQVSQRSDQVGHRLLADTLVKVEDVKSKRVEVSLGRI
jgi:allophanate hydrolase subunit 2